MFEEKYNASSETDFLRSVDELTPYDIEDKSPKNTGKKKSTLTTNIALLLSLCVFLGSLGFIAVDLFSKSSTQGHYQDLAADMGMSDLISSLSSTKTYDSYVDGVSPLHLSAFKKTTLSNYSSGGMTVSGGTTSIGNNEYLETMKAKIQSLKNANKDVYGWIYIENTKVDYPVVQSYDNDYYLRRSIDRQWSPLGTIFVDYRNSKNVLDNYNTVIYGHYMYDGTIFGNIPKFTNREFFDNTKIYIFTQDGLFVYEPFSIFTTKSYYQYFTTNFSSGSEFVSFCKRMQSQSRINKHYDFTEDDRIITLSTCYMDGSGDSRYALHARLIEVIQ